MQLHPLNVVFPLHISRGGCNNNGSDAMRTLHWQSAMSRPSAAGDQALHMKDDANKLAPKLEVICNYKNIPGLLYRV